MANITVGDLTPRNQYTATSGQTVFAYGFPIFADSDLKVYIGSTLKTLTTDYTVSGAASSSGGSVTLNSGATTGDIVTIYRDVPVSRTSDYQTGGDLLAETLNDDLDKLTMMVQQQEDRIDTSTLRFSQFTDGAPSEITQSATTRAGKALIFDGSGNPTISTDAYSDQLSSVTTQATTATQKANDASASAVAAAASAASAASVYDNFDDRYLGSKSTTPTTDNDGNALVSGAMYWDEASDKLRIYTTNGWINSSSATIGTLKKFNYTATSSQTAFSGVDEGGVDTLALTAGIEIVTLNGVVLEGGTDYTATSTSITLTSGADANDELNVFAFANFEVANHYTKTEADARYATGSEHSTLTASVSGNTTSISTINNTLQSHDTKVNTLLAAWPVGSVYISMTQSTSPASLFGGTWSVIGQGEVLIGAGTNTDASSNSKTFTVGTTDTEGEYKHELTKAEMPSHYHHTVRANATVGFGSDTPGSVSGEANRELSESSAEGSEPVSRSSNAGDGDSHNNLMPFLTAYFWRRTA